MRLDEQLIIAEIARRPTRDSNSIVLALIARWERKRHIGLAG